jgi:hypothetical protein
MNAAHGQDPSLLDADTAVLDVTQSKGLEFDAVLIADPAAILTASKRGHSDLYVAINRATQGLGILCPGELPTVLHPNPPGYLLTASNIAPSNHQARDPVSLGLGGR